MVAVVLTSIMSLVVFARLLSRRTMLGLEDLFVFISATFSIVYNALTIMQTRYGLGLPMKLRPVVDIYPYVVVRAHMIFSSKYSLISHSITTLGGHSISLELAASSWLSASDTCASQQGLRIGSSAGSSCL